MITTGSRFVVAMMVGFSLLLPPMLAAHCDTMGGPVIADAKIALETRDLTPALKWVKPEHEGEIRAAFTLTLKARAQGPEAHELADRFFFETLVRVHREGEGARYTGLKPMEAVEPITVESDKALESGNLDTLMKSLQKNTAKGVRRRFARAIEAGNTRTKVSLPGGSTLRLTSNLPTMSRPYTKAAVTRLTRKFT